jgi:outer membrane autotransporter protein
LKADAYQLGAYAKFDTGSLRFGFSTSVGYYKHNATRLLSFGTTNERVGASYSGSSIATSAELGFTDVLPNSVVSVTPLLKASLGYYYQEGFEEVGGASAQLEMDNVEAGFVTLGAGLEFSAEPMMRDIGVWPVIEVGVDYDFAANDDEAHSIGARINGSGSFVDFTGQGRGDTLRYGEFKLESAIGQSWTVDLSYRVTRHSVGEESSVFFGAAYQF